MAAADFGCRGFRLSADASGSTSTSTSTSSEGASLEVSFGGSGLGRSVELFLMQHAKWGKQGLEIDTSALRQFAAHVLGKGGTKALQAMQRSPPYATTTPAGSQSLVNLRTLISNTTQGELPLCIWEPMVERVSKAKDPMSNALVIHDSDSGDDRYPSSTYADCSKDHSGHRMPHTLFHRVHSLSPPSPTSKPPTMCSLSPASSLF